MAGDLEIKIGEISGQLKSIVPVLEELGKKLNETREKLITLDSSLKQAWREIHELKDKGSSSDKKWWDVLKIILAAVIGGAVTYGLTKIH